MSPRHRPTVSTTAWRRFRRIVTIGVFTTATLTGVGVGLAGASTSPVAPPATTPTAAPLPIPTHGDGGHGPMAHR
jgi:hypothetical protein